MKTLKIVIAVLFLIPLLSTCTKEEEIPEDLDLQSFTDANFQILDPAINSIYDISNSPDGGFVLVGEGDSSDEFPLIKLSAEGNLSWMQTYGNFTNEPNAKNVLSASDGGYLVAGSAFNGSDQLDAYLLKTDQNGSKEWDHFFGGAFAQRMEHLMALEDGGYLFCGSTTTENQFNTDLYFGRVNQRGEEIWTKRNNRSSSDHGNALLLINTEEFLLLSSSAAPPNNFDKEPILSKYHIDGSHIWTQSYGSGGQSTLDNLKIIAANDGGFLILSSEEFGANNINSDLHLIKVDDNGIVEWEKNYGGSKAESAYSLLATSDNAYLLLGYTYSYSKGFNDIYLVKVDTAGEILWARTYGGEKSDYGFDLAEKADGGFIIVGFQAGDESPFNPNMVLLKINAQGIPE